MIDHTCPYCGSNTPIGALDCPSCNRALVEPGEIRGEEQRTYYQSEEVVVTSSEIDINGTIYPMSEIIKAEGEVIIRPSKVWIGIVMFAVVFPLFFDILSFSVTLAISLLMVSIGVILAIVGQPKEKVYKLWLITRDEQIYAMSARNQGEIQEILDALKQTLKS